MGAFPSYEDLENKSRNKIDSFAAAKCVKELFLIYVEILSLLLKDIFFESFKIVKSILSFNITAAETTGPARHPLPTSSTPAIINFFN